MPSSTSRRRRVRRGARRRRRKTTRDWAELPLDAISAIFHKLDHIDILMGPGQVCSSWRRAARDEPELWRRIDMRNHADLFNQLNLHGMAQAAVRRSQGQCEAFWGEYSGGDDFLLYLGGQAPSLKSLRLISCYDVSNEGFAKFIEMFPLLEELELSLCSNVDDVFGIVGKACPQLKKIRLSKHSFFSFEADDYNKDDEALGIATMHKLCSLQVLGNKLTNEGLAAILDNCQHLESLDIRHCFNVNMNDNLRAKCARIKTMRLPDDSTHDYDFQVQSPRWSAYSDSQSEDYTDGYDYDLDSEDYDDYCDPSRYLNGVYEDDLGDEDRMLLRVVRVLMK